MHPAFKEVAGCVLGWGLIAAMAMLLFSPAMALGVYLHILGAPLWLCVAGTLWIVALIIWV